jgi:hypothetical protein
MKIELDSPSNIAYYLYIQQAYKPHSAIPRRKELLKTNAEYYYLKTKEEREERQQGLTRFFLNDNEQN